MTTCLSSTNLTKAIEGKRSKPTMQDRKQYDLDIKANFKESNSSDEDTCSECKTRHKPLKSLNAVHSVLYILYILDVLHIYYVYLPNPSESVWNKNCWGAWGTPHHLHTDWGDTVVLSTVNPHNNISVIWHSRIQKHA